MGNAYQNASLIVTPNAYKASKIYALKPDDGSGDLAFSRAGSKMVRNSSGLWETIGTNVPPLHYPVGGGCPSWLFEAESTNELRQNTTFTGWIVADCTLADSIQSPLSGVLAKRYLATNTGNYIFRNLITTGTRTVTGSIMLKNVDYLTGESFFVSVSDGVVGGMIMQYNPFDDTLTFSAAGTWTNVSIKKTTESEGFTRIEITGTVTSASGGWFECYGVNGRSLDIAAPQVETGSTATSPIITAGSSVTRLADISTTTGISALIGQTEGLIFWDINFIADATEQTINISDGTNYIYLQKYSDNKIYVGVYNGSFVGSIGSSALTTGRLKIALGYILNSLVLYINGSLIGTDLSSSIPACNRLNLTVGFTGPLEQNNLILYKTKPSNSEIAALTTL